MLAAVQEHPRKPGRYAVRLADDRAWLVDADTVGALPALVAGTALETASIVSLEAGHAYVAALDRALGLLARSRRTRREVALRLRRVGTVPEVTERVLERLEALGVLDDESAARAEASARVRRGEGARRVTLALRQKGVESRLIESVLHEVEQDQPEDEATRCLRAAEKRLRALTSYPPDVQRRRLGAWLLRRGYAGTMVAQTVRVLIPR